MEKEIIKDNLEFSKEWFTKEILKNHFEDKDGYIRIKKNDLFRLIIKFIKLIYEIKD